MDNETAEALTEALNRHSKAIEGLTFALDTFDVMGIEDAAKTVERAVETLVEAKSV